MLHLNSFLNFRLKKADFNHLKIELKPAIMKRNLELYLTALLFFIAACNPEQTDTQKTETEKAANLAFIQIEGNQLLLEGSEWIPKGMNVGNWLLQEDFMMHHQGTHSQMRAASARVWGHETATHFWKTLENEYITEADIKYLSAMGLNLIRAPFNINHFADTQNPNEPGDFFWQKLDNLIALCKKYDMYVLLDMHAVPGGQSPSNYADAIHGSPLFFEYKVFQEQATKFWVEIAKRYKDEPTVFGYGLLNEPNTDGKPEVLTQWLLETSRAIREVDSHHILVVAGDDWGKALLALEPELFEDPQVMPEVHFYPLFLNNFNRIMEYPTTINGKKLDKEAVKKYFDNVLKPDFGRPILLGEFGTRWNEPFTEASMKVLYDVFSILAEKNIGWSLWSYKDAGAMGFTKPKEETAWARYVYSAKMDSLKSTVKELKKINWDNKAETGSLHRAFLQFSPAIPDHVIHKNTEAAIRIAEGLASEAAFKLLDNPSKEQVEQLAKSFHYSNCQPQEQAVRFVEKLLSIYNQ